MGNYESLRADLEQVVGQDIDHNELIEKLEGLLKKHPPEWYPISELKNIPGDIEIELRGPVLGPKIVDVEQGLGLIDSYTRFRRVTPATTPALAQPVTIMALNPDPGTHERTMLIEISPSMLGFNSFKRRMFNSQVFNGLFITPSRTQVIRDPATSKEYAPSTFRINTIDTGKLLEGISGWNLESRVRVWLNRISSGSWIDHIPKEAYPFMIPYVVGSLADAVFQDWDEYCE